MTLEQILTDITAVLGAIGVISTVLAHLPLPAKYAQFFARLATYAANTKFSVNQRDPKPTKDEPKIPPMFPGAGVMLLAIACALQSQACSSAPPKPPCDPTTLALIDAECTAKAFECGRQGVPKSECVAIADCHARLDERAKVCTK
jgi:hypothetical protein